MHIIPCDLSSSSSTGSGETASVKPGQPQPGVVLRPAVEELVAAGAGSESDLSSVAPWPAEEVAFFGRPTASTAKGGAAGYARKDENCRVCTVTA